MAFPTYQPSLVVAFANNTGVSIPKARLISFTPEANTIANVYPASATGRAIGVTVDEIDAKQNMNVQVGGVIVVELVSGTTVAAGAALQAGPSGLAAAHTGTNQIVARVIEPITSSVAGARIRAILTAS